MKSQPIIDKTEVVTENGLVTAMHPLAAEAGLELLRQGGNAVDAAVAAAFAAGVVEPFMSGLGGAAYAVLYDAASDRTLALDGSVVMPRAAREDMFELLDPSIKSSGVYGWRGTKDDAAETGYRAVAVPGAVATYSRLLEMFGTVPWSEVVAPALRLAAEGFVPDWYVFANCASALERLRQFPETMSVFYHPDGTPISFPVSHDTSLAPDPERLVQTELAQTLRLIAEHGPDAFYRGEIGQAVAAHLTAHGGILTEKDLAEYTVRVRRPLNVDYRGKRVALLPENSGGPTVAQMLNILEGFELTELGHNSAESLHLIAEAQRMAFADRFAHLGDPALDPIPLEGLQSKAYAAERRRQIDLSQGPVAEPVGDPWPFQPGDRPVATRSGGGDAPDQHTTHLTVIDRDRNMVSLTATLGQLFGSGVVVPGTGVVLNNGMMWYDPEPGKVNSIGPGKRALHAATPALVFDEHGPLMALGAPGGRKVLTAVLQVMLNVLDFGTGMQAAISAPRIHCETGAVHIDARLPEEVIEALRRIGHALALREEHFLSSYFGRPNGVLIDRVNGVLRGGVEPYKVSMAVGF
jgi:gamma-glutamyltranspeptidase/glutathione hydrolase